MSNQKPMSLENLRAQSNQIGANPPSILAKIRDFLPLLNADNDRLIRNRVLDNGATSSDNGISVQRVEDSETETTDYESDDEHSVHDMDVSQEQVFIMFVRILFKFKLQNNYFLLQNHFSGSSKDPI